MAGAGRTDPKTLKSAAFREIRNLPSWIIRCGYLEGPDERCLWLVPKEKPDEVFPGQFVLDVPPGRYYVEVFDPRACAWISRESAEGGPLVAGIPFARGPLFVRVRLHSRPAEGRRSGASES